MDKSLFDEITSQLKARAIKVKTGTLVDATIIASASKEDGEGHWVKHKGKPAVHGYKAHVGADADTALVEEVAITPANVNDGKAGPQALPDNPGDVFADSAYRGQHFRERSMQRRHASDHRDGHVGTRRTRNIGAARRLEPADPSGARSDRKNFRHVEALLWAPSHAMARPRKGVHSGPSDSYRLQPETNLEHHRRGGVISAGTMAE